MFRALLNAFEGVTYTTEDGYTLEGSALMDTVAVVYFSRDAIKMGELMSGSAQVRIAWGGKEAVETVAKYPSMNDSETVDFDPKMS